MDIAQHTYRIDLKGLQNGRHRFDYLLPTEFFSEYGENPILKSDLKAVVDCEKAGMWMQLELSVDGTVTVACDRCLADLVLPVSVREKTTVRFSGSRLPEGEEASDEDIVLDRNEGELDLSQLFYDVVCLSLPLQKVHPEGGCDPVMVEKMKEIMK